VDRHNGFGFSGNGRLYQGRIYIKGLGINIHKHRHSSEAGNAAGGGKKGKGGCNHFIAGTNTQTHQAGQQCIGAAGNTHCIAAAAHLCNRLFKLLDHRAADAALGIQHLIDFCQNLILDCRILRF